jgi:hypothetical protein
MPDDVTREVDQLLKDRERYEAWLGKLESEKPLASGRAYDRVRADYQRRLDEVMDKLRAHSEAIRGKLAELELKLGQLEGERGDRAEKLDEARLRRSVGEYSDDREWKKLEGELLSSLQETEAELESVRAEIGRLEEIVALVEGAEAKPARPEPAAAAPEAAEVPGGEPAEESAPEPVAASAGTPESDEGLVSLEELVLGEEDLQEATVKSEPAAASEETEGGVGDELAFLESLSLGGNEEPESFSFLEQRGSGTPQTIICPHCSAANDPAEWYCTECGEELPAE